MRSISLLTVLLALSLTASVSAQSFFSGKKPAANPAPATVPAVTVTKPGSSSAKPDSDVRAPVGSDVKQSANASDGNVVFRPGDSLDFRISGIPQEDTSSFPSPITIGTDGFIKLTYLASQIKAAGLTQTQLERAIEKRFVDEKIFRWPTVTINASGQPRYVTIGGNVRSPNRYGWSADLTLMTAIATSGGPGDYAGDKINLIRGGTITLYRYKALKKNPADDPKLLPGDQVDVL